MTGQFCTLLRKESFPRNCPRHLISYMYDWFPVQTGVLPLPQSHGLIIMITTHDDQPHKRRVPGINAGRRMEPVSFLFPLMPYGKMPSVRRTLGQRYSSLQNRALIFAPDNPSDTEKDKNTGSQYKKWSACAPVASYIGWGLPGSHASITLGLFSRKPTKNPAARGQRVSRYSRLT